MAQTMISLRMDNELKEDFEKVCNEIGISMSTAFIIYAKKMTREHRIPFIVGYDVPNETTIAAMKEADEILKDPNAKRYASVDELFEDLDN